jgi:phage terminase large subunit GpA-like protein
VEKAIRKYVKGRGAVREWVKLRERNEQLDLAVYALAALYILGNGRAPLWLGEEAATLAKPLEGAPAPYDPPQLRIPGEILRRPRQGWVNQW